MKTSTLLGAGAAVGGAWYFFFRKLNVTSGTATLQPGKRYELSGSLSPAPSQTKNIMTTIAGSAGVIQAHSDGSFVAVIDATQPFAVTVGKATEVPGTGVSIIVTRVREL